MRHMGFMSVAGLHPPGAPQNGPSCVPWGICHPHSTRCGPLEPIPFTDPVLPGFCAPSPTKRAPRPDPHAPRGVRDPRAVRLGTRLVALAGGTDTMAAVAEFTGDHQAWFRR